MYRTLYQTIAQIVSYKCNFGKKYFSQKFTVSRTLISLNSMVMTKSTFRDYSGDDYVQKKEKLVSQGNCGMQVESRLDE